MSKTHLWNIETGSFTVIWGKHELVPLLGYGEKFYCCHSQETYSIVPEIAAYVLCTGLPMVGCAFSSLCQSLKFILFCGYSYSFTGRTVWLINWGFESCAMWCHPFGWVVSSVVKVCLLLQDQADKVIFLGLFDPEYVAVWSLKTSGTAHPTTH